MNRVSDSDTGKKLELTHETNFFTHFQQSSYKKVVLCTMMANFFLIFWCHITVAFRLSEH